MIQEPIQPTLTPIQPRSRRNTTLNVAIVILACLALAIPVIVAMAASPGPTTTLLAGASGDPESSEAPDASGDPGIAPQGVEGRNDDDGDGHDGDGHGDNDRGPGKGPITIRSIAGSSLALGTQDGWTRTIAVGPDTTITKGGVAIAIDDLKVGDEIGFRQTSNADGTYTITAITVGTPKAGGEVSAVDGDSITIKNRDGSTRVITVTSATVYKLGPNVGTKADVTVGTRIDAAGTVSGDTFSAISVTIDLAEAGGEVTAKTGDSITVKDRAGATTIIHVTASTTYQVKGKETGASLTDIAVGDRVSAEGVLRTDGSLDAVDVEGRPPKAPKPVIAPAPAASAAPG